MIKLETIDIAETRLQQLLNVLRDRKIDSAPWETIIMLNINAVDEILDQLHSEIEYE